MKKKILSVGIVAASLAGLFAFTTITGQTAITGKITPAEGAVGVWAINGKDTTKGNITSGAFTIEVKPGTYKLIVDGKEPYKDAQLENLVVKQDQTLDAGEIILQQ